MGVGGCEEGVERKGRKRKVAQRMSFDSFLPFLVDLRTHALLLVLFSTSQVREPSRLSSLPSSPSRRRSQRSPPRRKPSPCFTPSFPCSFSLFFPSSPPHQSPTAPASHQQHLPFTLSLTCSPGCFEPFTEPSSSESFVQPKDLPKPFRSTLNKPSLPMVSTTTHGSTRAVSSGLSLVDWEW